MPEQSTQSITVNAKPDQIMAVIADFPAYPEWAGSIKSAQVVERGADGRGARVRFSMDAGVLKDQYELAYSWNDDERVEWHLVQGQIQKMQRGSYTLRPLGDQTEVTYSLTVDLAIPMLGMLKRKAERVVMDTALKELKKRVESASG
jgi:ribosome-associated toxin RatA of RatAB toxin-antitoxin module